MSAVRVLAVVHGEVQGVGYRWFVQRQATTRGLTGSAVNRPDGAVEVVLEGLPDDVRAVVGALTGPNAPGRPTRVDQQDEAPRGERSFRIG